MDYLKIISEYSPIGLGAKLGKQIHKDIHASRVLSGSIGAVREPGATLAARHLQHAWSSHMKRPAFVAPLVVDYSQAPRTTESRQEGMMELHHRFLNTSIPHHGPGVTPGREWILDLEHRIMYALLDFLKAYPKNEHPSVSDLSRALHKVAHSTAEAQDAVNSVWLNKHFRMFFYYNTLNMEGGMGTSHASTVNISPNGSGDVNVSLEGG
jgi:hypothetical protein